MSTLLDHLASLRQKREEANITPSRRGAGAMTVPVNNERVTFGCMIEIEDPETHEVSKVPGTGFVRLEKARFISARLALQELREDHPDRVSGKRTHHLVLDTTFVVRGQVGLLDGDTVAPLPMETEVYPEISNNGGTPILFLFGQHQGVHEAAAEQLREHLAARKWTTRQELEGVTRKRETVWNLETRGAMPTGRPNVARQSELSNGAIDVRELVIRPTYYERQDGSASGFQNFVVASLENFTRWLDESLTLTEDSSQDDIDVVNQGLTSLTGARTQLDDDGKMVTYLDRAGIPEFTIAVPGEGDAEDTLAAISLWAPDDTGEEQDGSPIREDNRF